MTGMTDEVEKVLFLRKFNVPFWALSYAFGRDPSYWYRIEQSLGRNRIVGTTIRNTDDIPQHLAADEKHSWICRVDRINLENEKHLKVFQNTENILMVIPSSLFTIDLFPTLNFIELTSQPFC